MTDKCEEIWQPTDEQVDRIILPAMQGIAQQCAGYINQLKCPSEFIAVMLRDVADAFENTALESKNDSDSSCGCC
ncbi:hypothetical protein [Prochlorococcus marinus]|uniref:hypothetical protein n=1 Tax=Prochlorococcus marinus TaxID=1219 RepID=UPI0022B45986|nr:hypothetical protein [Prochlorococcus marinus]